MKVHLLSLAALFICVRLAAQAPLCSPPIGHLDVESGSYSMQPGVTFQLTHFSADLVPEGDSAPLCYGKTSVVSHAEIFASDQSLTNVFTSKLQKDKSKIKNFKVANTERAVTLSGTIKKGVPVNFMISGHIRTDGTAITLHVTSIKADGVPVQGLLELFGKNLSSVMKVNNLKGVSVNENTISFKLEQLAHLKGHITVARNVAGGLMLRYGPGPGEEGSSLSPALNPAPTKTSSGVSSDVPARRSGLPSATPSKLMLIPLRSQRRQWTSS